MQRKEHNNICQITQSQNYSIRKQDRICLRRDWKLLEIGGLSKVVGKKIHIHKSNSFLHTNNEYAETKLKKQYYFWSLKKYLDIYLTCTISVCCKYKILMRESKGELNQFTSVVQSCSTFFDPMNCSTPGLPVHHQLPEFTQSSLTSIESVMPSSHLILYCRLLLLPPIPPSIRVFSKEWNLRMRWPKYWSFSFSIIPSKEIPGLISFRMDWLDLLAIQGTLKSLLQHHSSKAPILRRIWILASCSPWGHKVLDRNEWLNSNSNSMY